MTINNGMNLAAAIKVARALGCIVEPIRRTGEVRVTHPKIPDDAVVHNSRRKDASRQLTAFLRRAESVV